MFHVIEMFLEVKGMSEYPYLTVLGVLGFEEKFIVRCALESRGKAAEAKAILYAPRPRDEFSREKIDGAWSGIKKFLAEYADFKIERKEVNPLDFWGLVGMVKNDIVEALRRGKVVICGGSGMRAPVIAMVVAAMTLPRDSRRDLVEINVHLESGEGSIRFLVSDAFLEEMLAENEFEIIKTISKLGGEAGVKQVSEALGRPKSTVSKLLKKMAMKGTIKHIDPGRYRVKRAVETRYR